MSPKERHLFRGRNQRNSMSYVVTIFTEKHLYRVNIEEGTKYTIGSGEKDAFPMSELGVDNLGSVFMQKNKS